MEKEIVAAVDVITVPPDNAALEIARSKGVSDDSLRTYFTKFKDDLHWEMTMLKTVVSPHLVHIDEIATVEHLTDVGWTAYIRREQFTSAVKYFEENKCTQNDVVRMGREIYEALAAAGGYGMVHGDINPDNILVTKSGSFMLAGFGIRRCVEKSWGARPRGDFDAPEVYEGGKFTPQSDIFSLGMVMAYILNGGSLPTGKNISILSGVDPALADIIRKATAYDPTERYSAANEMRLALESEEIGREYEVAPIKAPGTKDASAPEDTQESPPEAAPKTKLTKKQLIPIAAIAVVALAAIVVLFIPQALVRRVRANPDGKSPADRIADPSGHDDSPACANPNL